MLSLSKKETYKHILIWALLTIFLCVIDPVEGSLYVKVMGTTLIMLGYIVVYYAQLLIVFQYFTLKKNIKLAIYFIVVFIIYVLIEFINFKYVFYEFPDFTRQNIREIYDWLTMISILFVIVTIVALGTYQNKMSLLEIQAHYDKEKMVLNKELGFYKNQFNSHITFNFLNYCYNFFNNTSKETADVIELYSEMLRYSINNKPNEMVKLVDEIDYLNKFISLKKSLSNGVCVQFNVIGDVANTSILPRILITFVENAFKHGDAYSANNPISIKLKIFDRKITFEVSNQKNTHRNKPTSTGIGQNNLKEQLELFYKNSYQLIINDELEYYSTILILEK